MLKEKRLKMARKAFEKSREIYNSSEVKQIKEYSDMTSFERSIQSLKKSAEKGAEIINGIWGDEY